MVQSTLFLTFILPYSLLGRAGMQINLCVISGRLLIFVTRIFVLIFITSPHHTSEQSMTSFWDKFKKINLPAGMSDVEYQRMQTQRLPFQNRTALYSNVVLGLIFIGILFFLALPMRAWKTVPRIRALTASSAFVQETSGTINR
jgi:hypothetical protein